MQHHARRRAAASLSPLAQAKHRYDAAAFNPSTLTWPSSGWANVALLAPAGAAISLEPTGSPAGGPCVLFSDGNVLTGAANVGIAGSQSRTVLAVYQSLEYNGILTWGTQGGAQMYDWVPYGGRLINHYFGTLISLPGWVNGQTWGATLARDVEYNPGSAYADAWGGGGFYGQQGHQMSTVDTPLRLGTDNYFGAGSPRRLACVIIWDYALSDYEIDLVRAYVSSTYGVTC